jgi:hypothetical protein
MDRKKLSNISGSYILEYSILVPVIFACVFICFSIFLAMYQKILIQSIAEDAAQSISRQWGYKPFPEDQLETGVYKRETYESRETYWHLKLWNNSKKEEQAEARILTGLDRLGILKPKLSEPIKVNVEFRPGIPSVVLVKVEIAYATPGSKLLKFFGMSDHITVKGHARSAVYDPKDMINAADYIYQIIRETRIYREMTKKVDTLKSSLNKIINKE